MTLVFGIGGTRGEHGVGSLLPQRVIAAFGAETVREAEDSDDRPDGRGTGDGRHRTLPVGLGGDAGRRRCAAHWEVGDEHLVGLAVEGDVLGQQSAAGFAASLFPGRSLRRACALYDRVCPLHNGVGEV
jgi:hypothetical protein